MTFLTMTTMIKKGFSTKSLMDQAMKKIFDVTLKANIVFLT